MNIWGDTDLRISSVRRDLASTWRGILTDAAAVIPGAPWTQDQFQQRFGLSPQKCVILPPIVLHEYYRQARTIDSPRFVTLMNLNSHRRKNFPSLVRAIAELARDTPDVQLRVFGSCSADVLFDLRKIIAEAGAESRVILEGPLPNETFSEVLNDHVAFVMPTKRETFGMVFVEALFAGLPILHTRGWGVDGFFEDRIAGYACDPGDQSDVVAGLRFLLAQQARLKADLNHRAENGGLDRFKKAAIVTTYQRILSNVVSQAGIAPPENERHVRA